eukprot:18452-Heterococcus_DN1.PRE.2
MQWHLAQVECSQIVQALRALQALTMQSGHPSSREGDRESNATKCETAETELTHLAGARKLLQ